MKSPWRFFFMVEALLLLYAVWQIVSSPQLLILLICGFLGLYIGYKRSKKKSSFWYIIGGVAIFISSVSSPALWLMIIFAIIFIALKGVEISGIDPSKNAIWKKKQMVIVDSEAPTPHSGKKVKQPLFGNDRIGNQVFEWDDINLNVVSGDTIIDLGNTILPKRDNVIVIRKGFGRTRVLVPVGIAVMVEHSTFAGELVFEGEHFTLRNESCKIYSDDYDENQRRVKLLTNTLVGDLEVIRV